MTATTNPELATSYLSVYSGLHAARAAYDMHYGMEELRMSRERVHEVLDTIADFSNEQIASSEMGTELGLCLAESCPNVDRRILVGERISSKAVEECCEIEGCIFTEEVVEGDA